jgi:hypothetical protein
MAGVRVFRYIPELDAFLVNDGYRRLADYLGLTEWNPVVWIGRLFTLDNDYGEHWFDNCDQREAVKSRAQELGIDPHDLMFIDPERFARGDDGPCNTPELRKQFWTDVLKSLDFSYDLLFEKARDMNSKTEEVAPDEYIEDLERRIRRIQTSLGRPSAANRTVQPKLPFAIPDRVDGAGGIAQSNAGRRTVCRSKNDGSGSLRTPRIQPTI